MTQLQEEKKWQQAALTSLKIKHFDRDALLSSELLVNRNSMVLFGTQLNGLSLSGSCSPYAIKTNSGMP